ncbi:uncharacterized protein C1orf21 homolog isoform X2 [Pangasianodon hypophthalmus]|uniref:uncharacterized protein C1orf21 homolog isoform X2 n=1 Tax=Pangasianodon hypophthalmus TaxID=310915 RepID=UPI00147B52C0|nr:uncharacterized protein C1orf21 homolog isoform X2 [Pangasianodon hypophthalmus]
MGCASAKQVSAVPSDDEGRGKAYSNGDVYSDEYRTKGVEEVKYMRGEEDRVNARNQEKSSAQNKAKLHKEVPGANANRANIHTSESQQEFFRMLDEKIEKGRDYCWEEERARENERKIERTFPSME